MANPSDDLNTELAAAETRLAAIARLATGIVEDLLTNAARLASQLEASGGSSPRGDERLAAENLRANQETARAVEEIAQHGVRLRELPPAVWAE